MSYSRLLMGGGGVDWRLCGIHDVQFRVLNLWQLPFTGHHQITGQAVSVPRFVPNRPAEACKCDLNIPVRNVDSGSNCWNFPKGREFELPRTWEFNFLLLFLPPSILFAFYFFSFLILEIKPRPCCRLGKHSTIDLQPQPCKETLPPVLILKGIRLRSGRAGL